MQKTEPKGLIVWLLGAAGIFLIYCAIQNVTPASLIASLTNPKVKREQIQPDKRKAKAKPPKVTIKPETPNNNGTESVPGNNLPPRANGLDA